MDALTKAICESYRRNAEPDPEPAWKAVLNYIVPFVAAAMLLFASTAVWTPPAEAKDGEGWHGENPKRKGPPSQRPPATPVSWGRQG